ncbi:hypothetical protein OTU49_002185, partial [Cherax quadricarinatus]
VSQTHTIQARTHPERQAHTLAALPHESCPETQGRPVEWPPRPEQEDQDSADQIKNAPNLTTTYPSGFKYREQIPLDNVPAKVVMSQPAFKISQPIRRRGDDKWPPKGVNQPVQEEVS